MNPVSLNRYRNMCRTCLNETNELRTIFEQNLNEKLSTFTSVNVKIVLKYFVMLVTLSFYRYSWEMDYLIQFVSIVLKN